MVRPLLGGVAERLKAHAWKACIGETLSWVRIPPPPPSSSRATNRRRSSITEHSFHGIHTSRQTCLAGGVTHVSGTKRHLSLRPRIAAFPVRIRRGPLFAAARHDEIADMDLHGLAVLVQRCRPHLDQALVRTRLRRPHLEDFALDTQLIPGPHGQRPAEIEAWTLIVNRPLSPRERVLRRAVIASVSSTTCRADSRNSWPAAVGRVPPLVRSKSVAPN